MSYSNVVRFRVSNSLILPRFSASAGGSGLFGRGGRLFFADLKISGLLEWRRRRSWDHPSVSLMRLGRSLLVSIREHGTVGMQWDSKFGKAVVRGGVNDLVEGSLNIQMKLPSIVRPYILFIKIHLPST
jgi:hypothetical protein